MLPRPPTSRLFPYTTLFRSKGGDHRVACPGNIGNLIGSENRNFERLVPAIKGHHAVAAACNNQRLKVHMRHHLLASRDQPPRSEEHTSELQSLRHLVCRLLL